MLNIHIALNNNLCESQLNITDILSIAIPILCVLLTLLLTIFLSFLSDRRKLRYEIRKNSIDSTLKFLYLITDLKIKYMNSGSFNKDTINKCLLKLESFSDISPNMINQWKLFYDFLLFIYLNYDNSSKRIENVYNFYKSQHKRKTIQISNNDNDVIMKKVITENELMIVEYEIKKKL